MSTTIFAWFVLTVIFGVIAHFAIWARTGAGTPRWLSVAAFFVGSGICALVVLFTMGWSAPCKPYLLDPGKTTGRYDIVGAHPIPEERIYIFVDVPGKGPKVCHIPWTTGKDAQKIMDALEFGNGQMGFGNGDSLFGEAEIHTRPPVGDNAPKEEEQPQYSIDEVP